MRKGLFVELERQRAEPQAASESESERDALGERLGVAELVALGDLTELEDGVLLGRRRMIDGDVGDLQVEPAWRQHGAVEQEGARGRGRRTMRSRPKR